MNINHNIAALNAWRNLGTSNTSLSKSLEKLTSGYRINRGADDPAGLLISEQLRAQIGGLDQAIRNASDAISMVQTAEGALTEMNNMLNSIRALAVHAANTGSNDAAAIAADQTAVDKAVSSIQRIATTTKFAGKNLLDGTSTGATITAVATGVTVTAAGTPTSAALTAANSGYQDLEVNTAASYGAVVGVASYVSAGADNFVIKLMSGAVSTGYVTITKAGGESLDSTIISINQHYASTGLWASTAAAGTSLVISRIGAYGSALGLEVSAAATTVIGATSGIDYGVNVAASFAGTVLQGNGLVAYGSGGAWSSFSVTLTSALAGTAGVISSAVTISPNGAELKFALTDDASSTNLVSYGINNMQTTKIGNDATLGNTNGLQDIISGATYNLSTNAAGAITIIDKAISNVSTERANMGSFQKYTLETTINNLGVTKENLSASESRIRDVDMAAEMMQYTKNQILVQAGTAMLAQANQLPQTVLQLLKG